MIRFALCWILVYIVVMIVAKNYPITSRWIEEVDGKTMLMENRRYIMGSIPRALTTVIMLIAIALSRKLCQ